VSGGFKPASADAKGTLEDSDGFGRRPEWLRSHCDLGEARRLRSPGVHSRPSSSEVGRSARNGASRLLVAKDANELVRDALRKPGPPGG